VKPKAPRPAPRPALCPSTRAEPGAALLGIVGADGRVSYLKDRLEIDQAFLDEAGPLPEQRFRFSGLCVEHHCKQWDGCKCTVIENAAATIAPDADTSLRPCSIRPACRWFDQRGGEACRVCVFVITDTMEPAAERPA
jgi:hypothetical protein